MKKYYGVYGTLRKNENNHILLKNSKFITENYFSINYKMINLNAFPALIPSKDKQKIFFEIYEIDDETEKKLNILEGYIEKDSKYNFYNKSYFIYKNKKIYFYFIDAIESFYNKKNIIKTGNWKLK